MVGIERLEDLLGRATQLGAEFLVEIFRVFEYLAQLINDLAQ
jgi:hypothetical protein